MIPLPADPDSASSTSDDSISSTPGDLEDVFENVAALDTIDFGQCRDVLECIMEPNPDEESTEFFDVDYQVYAVVSHIMDLNWNRSHAYSRLSYFEDDRILLVEQCSSVHEVPFQYLCQEFIGFMYDFDRTRRALSTTLSLSYGLQPTTIPDMSIRTVAITQGYHRKVSVIGECAFAQDTNSVLRKIKNEIAANPEVLMVIMVLIDEHHPYRSPERMSEAWRMLRRETSARSPSSFHSLQRVKAWYHDKPVVVAGHTWCRIVSVRFHVWV